MVMLGYKTDPSINIHTSLAICAATSDSLPKRLAQDCSTIGVVEILTVLFVEQCNCANGRPSQANATFSLNAPHTARSCGPIHGTVKIQLCNSDSTVSAQHECES